MPGYARTRAVAGSKQAHGQKIILTLGVEPEDHSHFQKTIITKSESRSRSALFRSRGGAERRSGLPGAEPPKAIEERAEAPRPARPDADAADSVDIVRT